MTGTSSLQLGPYDLAGRAGGSFLYRGVDRRDQRSVAVKVLPAWQRSAEALVRFEREIKVEQAIQHVNLARFLDLGKERVTDPELVGSAAGADGSGEVFFFVREWVEGESLAERLARQGRMETTAALAMGLQAARGLAALHEKKVVHRNLNPRNVILEVDGTVKLVDFGLVKVLEDEAGAEAGFQTTGGKMLGTAGYMSPEQLQGGEIDARSDLFALGVLLYEAISGRQPFPTDSLLAYIHAIQQDEPEPLAALVEGVSAGTTELVGRLLSKDPAQRPASTSEVADTLERLLHAR